MKEVIVRLTLNASFYQEHAATMTKAQLLHELKGELQDQLNELKLERILRVLKQTTTKQAIYN